MSVHRGEGVLLVLPDQVLSNQVLYLGGYPLVLPGGYPWSEVVNPIDRDLTKVIPPPDRDKTRG